MVNRTPAAMRLPLIVCAWTIAMPALAQTTAVTAENTYTPEPAHIGYVDGVADVTREGRADRAVINVPLVAGDQVRTRDGRVEVLFGDASVLDIDHFTTVDFLSDELVRLPEGRIRLTIGGRDRLAYRVDTPSAAVRIESPGEYRIALVGESGRRDVELVTVRGFATLVNEHGETTVRAGQRAFANDTMAPSYAQAYNSATWDAFDRWSADRRDERTGGVSAQYLPEEVRPYAGDFDRYGSWQYDVSYGFVWYPTVAVGWRPYHYGRWSYYGPWGWTWISYHPWGWPTHHYGRWGFRAGGWFWIPSHHWGPAHVYWAGATNYVGWCPLGWDNRPIFAINVGFSHYDHHGYTPYHAWTVVPRHAFVNHVDVGRYAVPRNQLDHAVPRWYVSGPSAPIRPAVVRRDVTPIYSTGRTIRSAARLPAAGAGVGPMTETLGTRSPSGASRRDVAPARGGGLSNRSIPRAMPPASAGVLEPSADQQVRRGRTQMPEANEAAEVTRSMSNVERARPRTAPYREAGPGGIEPRYQPEVIRGGEYQRPEVGAPRGVPSGGVYGSRGVPSGGGYGSRGVQPRDERGRVYRPRDIPGVERIYTPPPPRQAPPSGYYPAPSAPSRGRPEGYGGGGYARPSGERPSYGPTPAAGPAPSRGGPSADRPSGARGGERAAPRSGGGSAGSSRASGHGGSGK